MGISYQDKIETHSTVKWAASEVFSSRRTLWMASFALFSAVLFLISPGIGLLLALVMFLSISHVIFVKRWTDRFLSNPVLATIAGSMLAAAILWVSVISGSFVVSMIGTYGAAIFLASLASLVIFVTLFVLESIMAMAVQFFITEDHDAAPQIACMLDMKFAGLLGEIK